MILLWCFPICCYDCLCVYYEFVMELRICYYVCALISINSITFRFWLELRKARFINAHLLIQESIKRPIKAIFWLFTKCVGITIIQPLSSLLLLIGQSEYGIQPTHKLKSCSSIWEWSLSMPCGLHIHQQFSLVQLWIEFTSMTSMSKSTKVWLIRSQLRTPNWQICHSTLRTQ